MIITTDRLLMRPLTIEDASERYLAWFRGAGAARIRASSSTTDISDLREYIQVRTSRDDVLFLGIFERQTDDHVGNLKYEPVLPDGRAVLGIFLGEAAARGKGYAGEAISAANLWIKDFRAVQSVFLGVEADNVPAIRAYQKMGFGVAESDLIPKADGVICMSVAL